MQQRDAQYNKEQGLIRVWLFAKAGKAGFSLIEMMIALFILTVAVLGLLNLTITSIRVNLQNDIRNTSIRLTSQTAEILLARPIDTIVDCGLTADSAALYYNSAYTYTTSNVCLIDSNAAEDYKKYPSPQQSMRGATQAYNVTWDVTERTTNLKEIEIVVTYRYRGQNYTNRAVIYKHRAV